MTAFPHVMLIIVARFMLSSAYPTMFGSSTLPRRDGSMAVFHYNNTIYILGGDNYPRQMILFDVFSKNITDYGNDTLFWLTYGDSQYYTQIGAIFYWIDPGSGHKINFYDLHNNTFWQYEDKMIYNVGVEGCLASYKQLLFVIGGTSHSGNKGKYQIFNLSSGVWYLGNDMLKPREQHTCMVDPKRFTLYAILGTKNFGRDVEKISFNNSLSNSWVSSSDLQLGLQSSSAVYYQDMILVFGGIDINDKVHPYIQKIECTNGHTSYIDPNMPGNIYATAIVYDYHRIFLFGGYNISTDTNGVATWQYIQLPTDAPTYAPSLSPTLPTLSPTTGYPTIQTNNPTFYPTIIPTISTNNPSKYPSINPSKNPTTAYTTLQTINPTLYPSNVPTVLTNNPTKYPSISTIIPSAPTLTIHPTMSPVMDRVVIDIITTDNGIVPSIENIGTRNFHLIWIYVLVPLLFLLLVVIIYVFVKRKQNNKENKMGVAIEMNKNDNMLKEPLIGNIGKQIHDDNDIVQHINKTRRNNVNMEVVNEINKTNIGDNEIKIETDCLIDDNITEPMNQNVNNNNLIGDDIIMNTDIVTVEGE